MIDLEATVDDLPLAILDVETTGLNPYGGDRVCEIAVLRLHGGEPMDALHTLVNPQRPMDPRAYAIHRIGDAMLAGKPIFAEVADDLMHVTGDAVLVGHNLGFDLGFLSAELRRIGRALPPAIGLCTLRLARRTYRLPSYGLGALASALGVPLGAPGHRAMTDVVVTQGVFRRLTIDLARLGLRSLRDLLELQGSTPHHRSATVGQAVIPPLIEQALASHATLRIRYRSAEGSETERSVTPLAVHATGGRVSLVAHCHLRGERRSFRLDRIIDMHLLAFGEDHAGTP